MFRFVLGPGQEFGLLQAITLLVFVGIFAGAIAWAIFASKRHVKHMSELPLEDQNLTKGE